MRVETAAWCNMRHTIKAFANDHLGRGNQSSCFNLDQYVGNDA